MSIEVRMVLHRNLQARIQEIFVGRRQSHHPVLNHRNTKLQSRNKGKVDHFAIIILKYLQLESSSASIEVASLEQIIQKLCIGVVEHLRKKLSKHRIEGVISLKENSAEFFQEGDDVPLEQYRCHSATK